MSKAKDSKQTKVVYIHISPEKKTSIGNSNRSLSKSMMNKRKKLNYKRYRGQGRP